MQQPLYTLVYLRAVVAVMVVLHHMPVQLGRLGFSGPWPELFASRVDVFFVLSGFIIWLATATRTSSPGEFLYRRLARILPLYWLMTAVVVGVMLVAPVAVQSGQFDLGHVLASFAFLPALHPVSGQVAPVLIPGWTLHYEVFFYVAVALVLPLRPLQRLLALCALFSALVLARPWLEPLGTAGWFYSSGLLLEFVLGMAVGAIYTAGQRLQLSLSVAMLIAGLVGLMAGPEVAHNVLPRALSYGVPSALLVAGSVFLERARPMRPPARPVLALSRATYAMFLSHGIVLSALVQAWRAAHLDMIPGSLIAFAVVALLASVTTGILLHRFVEAPLNGWLRQRRRYMASQSSVSVSLVGTAWQASVKPFSISQGSRE